MAFHVQAGVPNWLDAVQRLPAGVVVKCFEVQKAQEVKAANPAVKFWHRFWNDPYQSVNTDDTEAVRENRARGWFNQFVDGTFYQYASQVDYISFWNEYYAQSQTAAEKELWWRQERTAARIWRDEYRKGPNQDKLGHIRLTICAAAVGNDIPWQSAETAVLYDAVLDYHCYDWWQGGARHSSSWPFQSGRWVTMDNDYKARGYSVQWLFGEGGPYATAVDGWRHSAVCGGDVAKYAEAVKWWIDQCKQTAAYQQGRVLGPPTLFTTGGGSKWNSFETGQPELNAIADVVKANWNSVPAPPPPPPPDPPDPPTPPPSGNLINGDFEGGYEVVPGHDNIRYPAGWDFWFAPESFPNPIAPADPNAVLKQPEAHVLGPEDIPDNEEDDFIYDGDHTWKIFGKNRSIYFSLGQTLAPGTYDLSFYIFPDMYEWVGSKDFCNDPHCCVIWVVTDQGKTAEIRPIIGQGNYLTFRINIGDNGRFDVHYLFTWAVDNNGAWIDGFSVKKIEEIPIMTLEQTLWNASLAEYTANQLRPGAIKYPGAAGTWKLYFKNIKMVAAHNEIAVQYAGKIYSVQGFIDPLTKKLIEVGAWEKSKGHFEVTEPDGGSNDTDPK